MRYFQPNGKKNVKMKCPSGLQLKTGRRGGRRAQEMEMVIVGKENHFQSLLRYFTKWDENIKIGIFNTIR